MSSRHVLFAEPDQDLRRQLLATLQDQGLAVTVVSETREVLPALEEEDFDLVLIAKRLPDGDGVALLPRIFETRPGVPVIVMTAFYSVQGAVEAIKCGAFDYLPKPFSPEQFMVAVRKALETRKLHLEMGRLEQENRIKYGPEAILGDTKVIRELRDEVRQIALSEAMTILIQGESGTGKDLVAKVLHYSSPHASRPFVAISCSAIPDTLLESELFGHERGAFTDAKCTKRGLIELADGGTVFFDEVAELSLSLQAKLLRFLEERTFKRVGGMKDITVEVRIIAATNVRLNQAVAHGRFRDDLYFRLKVVPLTLPPLRERSEDIPLLARHFIDHFNKRFRKRFEGLTPEATLRLLMYSWPGNVRELRNSIERVMLLESGPMIDAGAFLLADNRPTSPLHAASDEADQDLCLERLELQALVKALERTGGNLSRAAKLLGVSRDRVRHRMRQYAIRLETRAVVPSLATPSTPDKPLVPLAAPSNGG